MFDIFWCVTDAIGAGEVDSRPYWRATELLQIDNIFVNT